ncbi:pectin acetylesterase 5-like isoform X2 [Phoenix dactylifera]|uniref:Pectin acetylesterase n=1 Tax=Phoenix dactylifera TaxID=42345 RepID=A0A8B9A894_PHODC|nr:pectin acetylesterase 5-like isoform X2 [Phoenix dactylifera]
MAIHPLRLWRWRRGGGQDRVIIALGFTILLLTVVSWLRESPIAGGLRPPAGSSHPALVHLTLLRNAKKKGAVCLDGSPPGYHFQRGFGSGKDCWLLHLEGGGWCNTVASCASRKMTALGSSVYMERQVPFDGILSNVPSQNPDFYNWNKVKIRYCDGASYSGNVESGIQNGTKLFFRGQRIWKGIMDELLLKGLANAKQAFLTGCSAGGLATFIHCEDFRALLPKEVTVKCLADAGFFLDEMDISQRRFIRSFYDDVIRLQERNFGIAPQGWNHLRQCFFAHEIVKNIDTPLFILNPAYDVWQIQHILAPESSDTQQSWQRCKLNIHNCDSNQIESLQGFRVALLNSLSDFQHNRNGGMFIDSCFIHCQTISNITWHSPNSPKINNKTIAEAVGDWYFNRREVKEIDCAHPCNPTCINLDLAQPWPGPK